MHLLPFARLTAWQTIGFAFCQAAVKMP